MTAPSSLPLEFQRLMVVSGAIMFLGRCALELRSGRQHFLAYRELESNLLKLSALYPLAGLHTMIACVAVVRARTAKRYLYHEACGGATEPKAGTLL